MRIGRLKLVNFLAFRGEHQVDLPAGPIGVFARYADNPRRSNWAGKTALLRAIRYALDGQHGKRTDDEIIHHGTSGARVELHLVGGPAEVVITRIKERGKPTVLDLQAGDFSARGDAARDAIEALLQMSGPDLESTLIFEQGDIESVCTAEAAERRQVITRWLRLERWTGYGRVAREHQRNAEAELDAARRRFDGVKARGLPNVDREIHGAPSIEDEIAEIDQQLEFLRGEVPELERRLATWRAVNADSHVQNDLQAMGNRLREISVPVDVTAEQLAESAACLSAAERKHGETFRALKTASALVTTGFDGTCPVTKSECPARDHVAGQRARFADDFRAAEKNIKVSEGELEQANRGHRALVDQQRQRTAALARREEMMTTMRKQRERVEAWRARMASVEAVDEAALVKQLEELRNSMNICQRKRTDLVMEKATAESFARQYAEADAEVEKWSTLMRRRVLVSKALGPTGIVARIASVQLRALEQRANDLLVGTGLGFEFAWERETKEASPVCYECGFAFKGKRDKACPSCNAERGMKRRDELEILVQDGSGQDGEDVATKSGGAKVLVASAIRLAGGMLLREQRNSPVRFALVDEPFGALDVENKTLLAQTFAGLLGSVGLEQALVVSHDEALLEALPVKVVVIRDGTSSRLEMEGS